MMAPALEKVRAVLGDFIYGVDTGSSNTVLSSCASRKTVAGRVVHGRPLSKG